MKISFFALFSFAVSAIATPLLVERQHEAQADEIDQLTARIKEHTARINETTAAVQDNPSIEVRDATAAQLAPEFEAITQALREASTTLAKRDWVSEVKRSGKCSHDCLLSKIQLLVWEIAFTLKFVIVKLGLGCVLAYLTPLLLALVGLIKALDKVVVGVLVLVKGLLTTVLGAVAGLLLGLIL